MTRFTNDTDDVRRFALIGTVALFVLTAGAFAGTPVAATQDDPSPPPAAYYGDVTIDGEPAPNGTTIEAEIDDEVRGSITIEQEGQYGGPNSDDRKLTVDGADSDEGATVEFYVVVDGNRTQADQTETWSSGDHKRVDLTVQTTEDDDGSSTTPTPTPTETPSGGDGGDGGTGGGGTGGGGTGGGGGGGAAPQPEPAFEVTATSINETVIDVNETVAVTVTIENTGDADGEFTARLTSDGFTLAKASVAVPQGETREVTIVDTFGQQGTYELRINDETEVATLHVGVEPAEVVAAETAPLDDEAPDEDGLLVTFEDVPVESITFSNGSATGNVTVEQLSRVPLYLPLPDGTVIEVVSIDPPETEADSPATLEIRVDASDLEDADASPEDLTVVHYDEDEGAWATLETRMIETGDGAVVVAAETPGFSVFAVTAQQQEEPTPTPTETAGPTPTPTDAPDEPTATGEPPEDQTGFVNPFVMGGILVVATLVAVLAVAGKRLYQNGGL